MIDSALDLLNTTYDDMYILADTPTINRRMSSTTARRSLTSNDELMRSMSQTVRSQVTINAESISWKRRQRFSAADRAARSDGCGQQAGVAATLDRFENAVAQISQTASGYKDAAGDSRCTARERSAGRRA